MTDNAWRTYANKHKAAGDLAKLFSGELSAEEAAEIGQWCSRSESYQREFLATAHALADLDALIDDADILSWAEEPPMKPRKRIWSALAVAAVLVLVVTAHLFYAAENPAEPDSIKRYATQIGERKRIVLEDGSVLTLNTGSQLLVSIGSQFRKVVLERGEVFFEVTSDPQRPFRVDLGAKSVTVLGTAFNIFKLPDQFTLAVVEGMVSLHENEQTVVKDAPLLSEGVFESSADPRSARPLGQRRVQAGMVAHFSTEPATLTAYAAADIDRFQTWRQGLVRFDAEPLYKVVQELNRYTGKKILIEDTSVMELKVYATVRVDQLDRTLIGLENSLPIKVVNHFDKIVITKK